MSHQNTLADALVNVTPTLVGETSSSLASEAQSTQTTEQKDKQEEEDIRVRVYDLGSQSNEIDVAFFDIDSTAMINPRTSDKGTDNPIYSIVSQSSLGLIKKYCSNPLNKECVRQCIIEQWEPCLDDSVVQGQVRFDDYLNAAWCSEGLSPEDSVLCAEIRRVARRLLVQLFDFSGLVARIKEAYPVYGTFFKSFLKFKREFPRTKIVWRTFGIHGHHAMTLYNEQCNGKCGGVDVMKRDEETGEPTLYLNWESAKTKIPEDWPCVRGYVQVGKYIASCGDRLIIEDYFDWARSGEAACRSKIFIPDALQGCKQVFFDDNANPNDTHHLNRGRSIVDSRSPTGGLMPDGKRVIRVDTVSALLDEDYFVKQVKTLF